MQSREQVVEWIDGCVLGDLRTVILGIQEREKRGETQFLGGCNFRLAGGCCEALEYFGRVYDGKGDTTAYVRRYAEKFLNPIDDRYVKVWPILWDSFRHGIVHTSWTKPVCLEGSQVEITVGANVSPDGDHLEPASDIGTRKSFVISSYRFFCDIERSFHEGFRDWILHESDDSVLKRAAPQTLMIRAGNTEGREAFEYVLRLNT